MVRASARFLTSSRGAQIPSLRRDLHLLPHLQPGGGAMRLTFASQGQHGYIVAAGINFYADLAAALSRASLPPVCTFLVVIL